MKERGFFEKTARKIGHHLVTYSGGFPEILQSS
jgi:hypothetical protein